MPQTGPKSQRGKAAVSRNAWKHGILSIGIVIDEAEDPARWEAHLVGMFESLKPEGHMLAERIAISPWKMRRIDYFQAIATRTHLDKARSDLTFAEAYRQGTIGKGILPEVSDDQLLPYKARRVLPADDDLVKIMRYESHLHRLLIQTPPRARSHANAPPRRRLAPGPIGHHRRPRRLISFPLILLARLRRETVEGSP